MATAPGSLSEGPCLEPGHVPLSPAAVTARHATLHHGVPVQVQTVLEHTDSWHGLCIPAMAFWGLGGIAQSILWAHSR